MLPLCLIRINLFQDLALVFTYNISIGYQLNYVYEFQVAWICPCFSLPGEKCIFLFFFFAKKKKQPLRAW